MGVSNDIIIIATISAIFIFIGLALPFVQNEYGVSQTDNDAQGLVGSVDADNFTILDSWKLFLSVITMFFWSFGALPLWLDSIFILFRLILALTVARNIWVGGGG